MSQDLDLENAVKAQERELERAVKEFQAGINTRRNAELITQRLEPYLWRIFRRNNLLGNEYEDLTQETFFRVFEYLGGFRFESSFKTWVKRIAGRVLIDAIRRRNAHRRFGINVSYDDVNREENKSGALAIKLADDSRNPEKAALKSETVAIYIQALETLSQREREVLRLHTFKELSNKEIAIVLGIAENTVKVTLHNARKKVKAYLKAKL